MAMTADAFDAAILKRCFWSSSTAPLTQAERLLIADEEIAGELYPRVIAAHSDYYLTTTDLSITADQEFYRLPARAFGPIKDVVTVDDAGNEYSVGLLDAADLGHGYGSAQAADVASYRMHFAGDFIGLRRVPSVTQGSLRVRYYRQPNALCLVAQSKVITSVNVTTKVFGASSPNALWTTSSTLCVISAGNAHQALAEDLDVSAIDASSVTVTNDISAAGIAIGDYLATTLQTPLVQLPDFMLTAAVRHVAAACLAAHGDVRASTEHREASRLIDLAFSTAIPRVEGEPKVTRTRNSPFRRAVR